MALIYPNKTYNKIYIEYTIPIKQPYKGNISLDFNQINDILSMLNSNDNEDISLAMEIIRNIHNSMDYEVLIWKLMSTTHNWALSDDGQFLKRRKIY